MCVCVCVSGDNRKPLKVLRTRVMIRSGPWKSESDYDMLGRLEHCPEGGHS